MMEYRTLKLALLGSGSVGSQVARLLLQHADELAERTGGARIELAGIAVRDLEAERELPAHYYTDDAESLILHADIVVELIGGINPARELITKALETGADIVTANKALLAAHGTELFALAENVGAQFLYEAAVGGAIPVLRPLKDSLAGDRIMRVMGIVNGTTNFILDRMERTGEEMQDILRLAQELGYAEADPTADVGGHDAAAKAAILASLAFHTNVPLSSVYCEGITAIDQGTIQAAAAAGKVIKLLAICERLVDSGSGKEGVNARVYPALINKDHPLAAVHENNNAVFVQAEAAGDLMFYGAGAGGLETASAVLGDIVSIARRYVAGGPGIGESNRSDLEIISIDRVPTRYQVILQVSKSVGALAQIAQIFAEHQISFDSVTQSPYTNEATTKLVIGTMPASEAVLATAVERLKGSIAVAEIVSVVRIEGGNN